MKPVLLAVALFAAAGAARAQELGVPACDAFLTKYEACMARQGAAAQAQYSQMIAQWRSAWKTLADNPQTKPTLENICKQ